MVNQRVILQLSKLPRFKSFDFQLGCSILQIIFAFRFSSTLIIFMNVYATFPKNLINFDKKKIQHCNILIGQLLTNRLKYYG